MTASANALPAAGSDITRREFLNYAWLATIGVVTAEFAVVTYLFALPGSPGACKDGWDEILKDQLDARHRPCNFVELMPRLNER